MTMYDPVTGQLVSLLLRHGETVFVQPIPPNSARYRSFNEAMQALLAIMYADKEAPCFEFDRLPRIMCHPDCWNCYTLAWATPAGMAVITDPASQRPRPPLDRFPPTDVPVESNPADREKWVALVKRLGEELG